MLECEDYSEDLASVKEQQPLDADIKAYIDDEEAKLLVGSEDYLIGIQNLSSKHESLVSFTSSSVKLYLISNIYEKNYSDITYERLGQGLSR